jgi:hypothetical protein
MHFSSDFVARVKSFRTNVVLLVSVLLIFNIFTGCAIERNVKDNRFYSSYPSATVDVDKEFKFLGSGKYTPQFYREPGNYWSDGYDTIETYTPRENNFYFFVPQKIKEQTIPRGILVQILIPLSRYHYASQVNTYIKITERDKNVLAHNFKSFGKNTHEYYITVVNRTTSLELTQWLNQKGYQLPSCTMEQHIIEICGDGAIKQIIYFEDATVSGNNCVQWKGDVARFTERADRAVQLVEF